MSMSESLQKLNSMDLSDLDFENVGSWPTPIKVIACMLLLAALLFAGWHFQVSDQLRTYETEQQQELTLKKQFEKKAFEAANLEAYEKQLEEMEVSFSALLKQLPGETEVPGLLDDITLIGRGSGLSFDSINLQPEQAQEFYVELPIKVVAKGTYHDLATFVSGVASLPRIVTLHDFSVAPGNDEMLTLDILAKTYRYKEQEGMQ